MAKSNGSELCDVPHCRKPMCMTFLGKRVCASHWVQECNGAINLKEVLKVRKAVA